MAEHGYALGKREEAPYQPQLAEGHGVLIVVRSGAGVKRPCTYAIARPIIALDARHACQALRVAPGLAELEPSSSGTKATMGTMRNEPDLATLRDALVRGLRVNLAPDEAIAAFERHQLLAIRFTRVARLNAPSRLREGQTWCLFFEEHFPRGDEHAQLLWAEWRTPLLKDETPGANVAISHGQPRAHWQPAGAERRLFIDLESMWDDYEASVHHFITACEQEKERRDRALGRWGRRQWEVKSFVVLDRYALRPVTASASAPVGGRTSSVLSSGAGRRVSIDELLDGGD